MSRRSRIVLIAAGSLAGTALLLAAAAVVILRSEWFFGKVRGRVLAEMERATGGRAEIGRFRFDWKTLTATVDNLVLRGAEPAGKPPLFRADSVAIGLKIVSLVKKQVDLDRLQVNQPRAYLIVYPDGRTNVPEPRIRRPKKPVLETILDLAVKRFEINRGTFEVENRFKAPFDARGQDLRAKFGYDFTGPRYSGTLSVHPLDFRYGSYPPLPVHADMNLALERNRVLVESAQLAAGASRVSFSGAVENVNRVPSGTFRYEARLKLEDAGRFLALGSGQRGELQTSGTARFLGAEYEIGGELHAAGVTIRSGSIGVREARADGDLRVTPGRVEASHLRLSGVAAGGKQSAEVGAQIAQAELRNRNLELTGLRVATLGGTFEGRASLRDFDRYMVEGGVEGFDARRLMALADRRPAPWNGRISGPVRAEGSLSRKGSTAATARLSISPAPDSAPVNGEVQATYDQRSGVLDLGRSYLQLPATRLDLTGSIGRRLDIRLTSTNLDDLLPALNAPSLPLKLENGKAAFTGAVTGTLESPRIDGRAALTGFNFQGRHFDSLQAGVTASPGGVTLRDALVARGSMRAQFAGTLALTDWKTASGSAVSFQGSIQNADVRDLAALAGHAGAPVSGKVSGSAQVTGTAGNPLLSADVTAVNGELGGEPYDRIAAKVAYSNETLQVTSGSITAGQKRIDLAAAYRHARGDFGNGRLEFQTSSNSLPLDQVQFVAKRFPALHGTVLLRAQGAVDVVKGQPRVADLNGDVTASGIQSDGQPLGDAHLTASSQGGVLTAHLESNFADAVIKGDGRWKLADDYPGTARLTFSGVNLTKVQNWIEPGRAPELRRIAGAVQGEATLKGPILDPQRWTATLRIPDLRVGPAPGVAAAALTPNITLRNSGPIVVTMVNGAAKIQSARLVGRATDVNITGTITPQQRNAVDLKVNGRVDLAMLQDFDRDMNASGAVVMDAAVRGALNGPQVTGQMEMQGATFNYGDLPAGIYNARGLIRFTGTQATIQYLEGESGGGKVTAAGFIGYGGGNLVFRLRATAKQVRLRFQGASIVSNASLNWTGTSGRSTVAGTVTIARAGFNPRSDFSNLLARSAEPVRTPSARTGVLSGMRFDVQIETAPDLAFQSTLTQDIQMDANLRLRGTATNPSLLGRINITQGQVMFFGTAYTINQGAIAFYNPMRIEPILNIDLETRARGVDVTLTVTGPINKLNLTPRSDPPLQFNEIVALLATGRAPTSDPNLLAQQTTSPQTWQQMGASALLGQAIANPVAGRLQRFFGITRLKIDPTLTGVENNPQARLTLEQQVTPNITFTYITNVTNSNPLVVQVEWAISRKWSVIAIRDENGYFGIDFFYKKRF
ncbi:MAG: translocation/assembly module TamB domain-containing protein [Bryobacteraceae bacterium]